MAGKSFKYHGHRFRLCRTAESIQAGMMWFTVTWRDRRLLPEAECPLFATVEGARAWADTFPADTQQAGTNNQG